MSLNIITRTGKIARLPLSIRDQLNRRLLDNEPGTALLDWLNSLPEVQAILAAEFASQPISPANLSQWKAGGYRDWLTRLDALALARDLQDHEALGHEALAAPFADKLAHWLSLHYASAATRALAAEDLDPDTRWRFLRQFSADVARLQREEHQAQRIDLERQRVELQLADAEFRREKELSQAEFATQRLQDLVKIFFPKPAPPPPPTDSHPTQPSPANQS